MSTWILFQFKKYVLCLLDSYMYVSLDKFPHTEIYKTSPKHIRSLGIFTELFWKPKKYEMIDGQYYNVNKIDQYESCTVFHLCVNRSQIMHCHLFRVSKSTTRSRMRMLCRFPYPNNRPFLYTSTELFFHWSTVALSTYTINTNGYFAYI